MQYCQGAPEQEGRAMWGLALTRALSVLGTFCFLGLILGIGGPEVRYPGAGGAIVWGQPQECGESLVLAGVAASAEADQI